MARLNGIFLHLSIDEFFPKMKPRDVTFGQMSRAGFRAVSQSEEIPSMYHHLTK